MSGKSVENVVVRSRKVEGRISMGPVLVFLAQFYGSLEQVLIEMIQNQLDAGAKNIRHEINLGKNSWSSWDDGCGASEEEMEKKYGQIGETLKSADLIGEKGLGHFAGLAIAQRVIFISKPRGSASFVRYPIDREEIKNKRDIVFDFEVLDSTFTLGNGWSSSTALKIIDKGAIRSFKLGKKDHFQDLCDGVASAYRDRIRRGNVRVEIFLIDEDGGKISKVVTPLQFPGKREVVEIPTKIGPVLFEMFLTSRPQKKPSLTVTSGAKYGFPLSNLDVWEVVSDTLGGGHFQGNIAVDFCTLKPDRTGFQLNEEYEVFLEAVLKFVAEYAQPWLKKIYLERRDDRLEEATSRAIDRVDRILKNNKLPLDDRFQVAVIKGQKNSKGLSAEERVRTKKKSEARKDSELPLLKEENPPLEFPEKKNHEKRGKEKGSPPKGISSGLGTKRRAIHGQSGIQIVMVEAEGYKIRVGGEGEGNNKGKVLLNTADRLTAQFIDRATNPTGRKSLEDYIANLVLMVVCLGYISTPERARIFQDEFERTFLEVIGASSF